jgi:hypothetical protein
MLPSPGNLKLINFAHEETHKCNRRTNGEYTNHGRVARACWGLWWKTTSRAHLLLAIFEIAAFTLSIATTQPLRLYSVAANPKAGFPERQSGIEENATKSAQVGGGLTSAVLDSSGVAGCIRPMFSPASNAICG